MPSKDSLRQGSASAGDAIEASVSAAMMASRLQHPVVIRMEPTGSSVKCGLCLHNSNRYWAVQPPSTGMLAPVIEAAASEHRKSASALT